MEIHTQAAQDVSMALTVFAGEAQFYDDNPNFTDDQYVEQMYTLAQELVAKIAIIRQGAKS